MRAHEVPTHVGAEDKVLLWFTFPQIVAMIATCALAYGAYRMAPIGPSEVRLGIAVILGLLGLAAIVGKVGGRSLPLVTADLPRYALGPRRYAGTPGQLVRSEPPAPIETKPGPLSLMVKKAGRGLRKPRRLNKSKERRKGRRPFRPHGWFGKRRRAKESESTSGNRATQQETSQRPKRRKARRTVLGIVAVAALALAIPQVALADGHWGFDFEPPEPVPGRRLFVEGLSVSGDRAEVTLRAATSVSTGRQAWTKGRLSPTTCRCPAKHPPSPSPGRTPWGRREPSPSRTSSSRTRCPRWRETSATSTSPPWAGRRGKSRGSCPPTACPRPWRPSASRRWLDMTASRRWPS